LRSPKGLEAWRLRFPLLDHRCSLVSPWHFSVVVLAYTLTKYLGPCPGVAWRIPRLFPSFSPCPVPPPVTWKSGFPEVVRSCEGPIPPPTPICLSQYCPRPPSSSLTSGLNELVRDDLRFRFDLLSGAFFRLPSRKNGFPEPPVLFSLTALSAADIKTTSHLDWYFFCLPWVDVGPPSCSARSLLP